MLPQPKNNRLSKTGGPPNCFFRFQSHVNRTGIEDFIRKELILDIEKALEIRVYLKNNLKAYEVNPEEIEQQALYDPIEETIYLRRGSWCKVAIIHELLHAASFFAHPQYLDLGIKNRPVVETITEFLTGYVLWKHRKKWPCYEYWVLRKHQICSVSYTMGIYKHGIRALAALCRVINIKEIIKLFIWDPSLNFHTLYNNFIEKHGFTDFLKGWDSTSLLLKNVEKLLRKHPRRSELIDLMMEAPLEVVLGYADMKT